MSKRRHGLIPAREDPQVCDSQLSPGGTDKIKAKSKDLVSRRSVGIGPSPSASAPKKGRRKNRTKGSFVRESVLDSTARCHGRIDAMAERLGELLSREVPTVSVGALGHQVRENPESKEHPALAPEEQLLGEGAPGRVRPPMGRLGPADCHEKLADIRSKSDHPSKTVRYRLKAMESARGKQVLAGDPDDDKSGGTPPEAEGGVLSPDSSPAQSREPSFSPRRPGPPPGPPGDPDDDGEGDGERRRSKWTKQHPELSFLWTRDNDASMVKYGDAYSAIYARVRADFLVNQTLEDYKAELQKVNQLAGRYKVDKDPNYDRIIVAIIKAAFHAATPAVTWRERLRVWYRENTTRAAVVAGTLAVAAAFALPGSLAFAGVAAGLTLAHHSVARTVVSYDRTHTDVCTDPLFEVPKPDDVKCYEGTGISCNPKTYSVGFTTAREAIWVPRSCCHNERVALYKRQLLPALGDADERKRMWQTAVVGLYNDPVDTLGAPFPDWRDLAQAEVSYIPHLDGRRRIMYATAWKHLVKTPHTHCKTNGFVKREVLLGRPSHKLDPRFISAKQETYWARSAAQYYSFYKDLTRMVWPDDALYLADKCAIFAGGLKANTLGELVSMNEARGWYAVESDLSRCDGHMEVEALEAEMWIYEHTGCPRDILDELCKQLVTDGSTPSGIRFFVPGKRASGVINTTLGNSLLCLAMYDSFFRSKGVPSSEYQIIQLGDDNVIFTRELFDFHELEEWCFRFGHKVEAVLRGNTQDAYDRITFCSGYFWDIGGVRVLGPKPFRCLAKTFVPTVPLNPRQLSLHLGGVAASYKNYAWIPVLGEVCRRILEHHQVGKIQRPVNPTALGGAAVRVDDAAVHRHFVELYGMAPEKFEPVLDEVDFARTGIVVRSPLFRYCGEIDGVFDEGDEDMEVVRL